jgi:hypothetical protein
MQFHRSVLARIYLAIRMEKVVVNPVKEQNHTKNKCVINDARRIKRVSRKGLPAKENNLIAKYLVTILFSNDNV